MEKTREKRKVYVVKIGEELKKVLDEQKRRIKDRCYGVVEASDYEAGEIIAKKVKL